MCVQNSLEVRKENKYARPIVSSKPWDTYNHLSAVLGRAPPAHPQGWQLSMAYEGQRDYMSGSVAPTIQQINRVIEKIGYMGSTQNGFTIFVEKSNEAIAVAEILPKEVSYKVIAYNHYSMKGAIEQKKDVLLKLANLLEGKRKKLSSANPTLEDNLFYAFNNLNIRHSNVDINSAKYKKYVAEMSVDTLENWYDEVYQMCLLAFLEIDNLERKKRFIELKNQIESAT